MQPAGKLCGTREISQHESIPHAFLAKVLLPLRRARLLRSFKGMRGGYELTALPEQISLLMIVRSIDGEPLTDCLLEDHPCSSPRQCVLHSYWSAVREQLLGHLERTTLVDLVRLRQAEAGPGPAPVPAVVSDAL